MTNLTENKERIKLITDMHNKGWTLRGERHRCTGYVTLVFGKYLERGGKENDN